MKYEEIDTKYRGDSAEEDGTIRALEDDEEELALDQDFDEKNLTETKIIMLLLITGLFVTNYFTYRAHIVTLQAFKIIKMQNIKVEGF